MRLRIRFQEKVFTLTLPDSATISDLTSSIKSLTSRDDLKILYKFPLKELDVCVPGLKLNEAGVESSETLVLEPHDHKDQITRGIPPPPKPLLALKEIPDDNNCLFNSIGFVLENQSLYKATELRHMVAQYILARPLEYTAAILGKSPRDYANWIQEPDKWGGAIELAIFSEIYGVEIGSFDVQSGRLDLFGEDRNLFNRVYLQYTGIHYEAFYTLSPLNKEITTIFPSNDTQLTDQIRDLVLASKAAHRYTDTSKFTLRCGECRIGLEGQAEAQKHAQNFKHFNFIEYTD